MSAPNCSTCTTHVLVSRALPNSLPWSVLAALEQLLILVSLPLLIISLIPGIEVMRCLSAK